MVFAYSFVFANVGMSFAQQRAVSVEQEKEEIRKVLNDEAQAANNFHRTHDVEGNLRFYAPEFFEIRDGEIGTLANIRQNLKIILEQLKLGKPLILFVQYSNISVDVTGSAAWASYDMTLKYGLAGELTTRNKKCTSIFKRNGSSWLFVHDHCSTVKEMRPTSPRMDNN